jgi:hypothetical protein
MILIINNNSFLKECIIYSFQVIEMVLKTSYLIIGLLRALITKVSTNVL